MNKDQKSNQDMGVDEDQSQNQSQDQDKPVYHDIGSSGMQGEEEKNQSDQDND